VNEAVAPLIALIRVLAAALLVTACDVSSTSPSPLGEPTPVVSQSQRQPGEYPEPDPRLFRIDASPKLQSISIGERTSIKVRVRVPVDAEVLWEVVWGDRKGGYGVMGPPIVDCFSPPPGPSDPIVWETARRDFRHVFKEAGRYVARIRVSAADCGYGKLLRDQVTVDVSR